MPAAHPIRADGGAAMSKRKRLLADGLLDKLEVGGRLSKLSFLLHSCHRF